MEVDGGGDESAPSPGLVRGKKRPPSPSSLPGDGEGSPTSDEDDNPWAITDDEEEDEYQGKYRPYTVDDFPRVSTYEQQDEVYENPESSLRGPKLLWSLQAFKPEIESHPCGTQYRLSDESEISVHNVGTIDCSNECRCFSMNLLQFIGLKIAGYHHAQPGSAKIFGFFATRDQIEPLRNYVYRREIDNYEVVTVKPKTGMARLTLGSPARGICMTSHVLFEFKLCVRTEIPAENGPKDDLLIEGCAEFSNMMETKSFSQNRRIYGEKCGLDVKFLVLINAVQAFVDVEILRAPTCGFNLNLYAKTSGFSDVIRLYRGSAQAACRMSSVVAVEIRSYLDLRIEGTPKDDGVAQNLRPCVWGDRFDSCYHGTVDKVVNLDEFTIVSVKITWRTVD
ncbi:uncharacterized protein LOC124652491 [Lolium rigidum]|uniref:uncharacterized protein LOC124652491 n=1 Tax=Lolium rigidum TaxID=89674 RepID=UPI001F5D2BD5|nr:uncharacterized protein LOC124652491 [Lolium rigidum]